MPLPMRSSAEVRVPKPRREWPGSLRKRPPRVPGTLPFTLLSDPTPLIGRDQELEGLRHYLLRESLRLVTVIGPGRVGKTPLALAAARRVQDAFPHRLCFIDRLPPHAPPH